MARIMFECESEKGLCENCKKVCDIEELDENHGFFYCPRCLPEIEKFWQEN